MKTFLAKSASVLTLALVAMPGSAFAQTSAASDTDSAGLEDIVVTAERRSTNVQDVPISITAISGDELLRQNVIGTRGLGGLAPNVNIGQDARGIVISVRGVSSQGVTFSRDPSIAFHVDGVYQPRPTGASGTFYDLDRVEVLRGPQGTLYGRNATGGAVNVITAKPTFTGVNGYANLSYGNYDAISGQAAINLPLVSDKLALRVAGSMTKHDPYAPNLASGMPGLDDQDDQALRAHLLFVPANNVRVLLSSDYQWQGGHGALIASLTRPARSVQLNTPGYQRNRLYGTSAEISVDLGGVEIVSLTSSRRDKQLWVSDGDETTTGNSSILLRNTGKQFSQEVRLVSNGEGPLQWIAGANYFRETNADEGTLFTALNFQTGTAQQRSGRRSTAKSVFGQFDYTIADVLTLTAGARYTEDSKIAPNGINQNFTATTNNGLNITTFVGTNSYVASTPYKSDKITWRVGAKWDVSDQSNVYASVVTGYKAGGLNTPPFLNYDPETLTAYEFGTKNRFADNRLQLNASAFLYKYKDYQINSATTIGGVLRSVFSNAGEATIKGFEVEAVAEPVAGLRLDGSVGILATNFDDLSQAYDSVTRTRVDMTGNDLPRAPKLTWRLAARYDISVGDGTLTPSVSLNGQSRQFLTEFNDRVIVVGTTTNNRFVPLQQAQWAMINAGLRYEAAERRWFVEAFGQNLANKLVLVTGALNTSGFAAGSYAPPRTYGVRIGGSF